MKQWVWYLITFLSAAMVPFHAHVFQLSPAASALAACPFSRVCSDSVTEMSPHRSSHSRPGLHISWGDAGTKLSNCHKIWKRHRRTFFITCFIYTLKTSLFSFVSRLVQHDLPWLLKASRAQAAKADKSKLILLMLAPPACLPSSPSLTCSV